MNKIDLVGYPVPVPIDTIVWLEGEANYTRVHFQNGTFVLVTQPLRWFEYHLNFVRVHRSAIVNPACIQAFDQKPGRSGWVKLVNGRVIPISRNRLNLITNQLTISLAGPLSPE